MSFNFNLSYSYDDIIRSLLLLKKNYSHVVHIETIGISHDHREIPLVKIGKDNPGPLYLAGVHARESINPVVLLACMDKLIENYYAKQIPELENYTLYFIPLLNPDGYEIATNGYDSIKDQSLKKALKKCKVDASEFKYNAKGIDINRNFDCKSYVKSKTSGTKMSEPETKALVHACELYHFMGMIDFHSRGNSIYYYREAMSDDYNQNQLEIAQMLSKITGYHLNIISDENPDQKSGGNTVHYFSEHFSLPALTIETIEDEATFPLSTDYRKTVYEQIKKIPLEFLKILIAKD